MECIIPTPNIKIISKAIQGLAKINDELHIEVKEDNLSFIATNTTKTVFAKYIFHESFFSSYHVEDTDSQDTISCKIPMKSILKIFKFKPQKEKKMELCKIELKPDVTNILFKFRYKHDTNVVHQLNLLDFETLSISYKTMDNLSCIIGTGHLFMRVLANLQMTDNEINVEILKDKAVVRNYDTSVLNSHKGVRSQMTLKPQDFLNYQIKNETNLTFSLKAFRSAIHFADAFNLNVMWKIESWGKPTVISIKTDTFDVEYIVATANIDGTSQATSLASSVTKVQQINSKNTEECNDWNLNNENNNRASFNKILNNLIEENLKPTNVSSNLCNSVGSEDLSESPSNKKIRLVFGRCFEPTFHKSMLNNFAELAPNSDSEREDEI